MSHPGNSSVGAKRRGPRQGLKALCALVVALLCAAWPGKVWGCAACYGASDSPMAEGMNWGILSLLAIIALVLVSIAAFFVFLARKSAALSAASASRLPRPASADSF